MKSKYYALILMTIGALTIPIVGDATFFIFSLIMGISLLLSKESWAD